MRATLLIVMSIVLCAGIASPAMATSTGFAQGGEGPCAATSATDAAEGGPLDVTSYGGEWRCETDTLRFTFVTAAGWGDDDLSTAYVRIDTDGDITNGCSEADVLLYAVNEPDDDSPSPVAGVFSSASCDDVQPLGSVSISHPAPTLLVMEVDRALIGDPGLIRHYGSLAAVGEDNRTADYVPDTGGLVLDMRPLPDPESVGVCIPDPVGDVVLRGADGSSAPIEAPRLDLTEVCSYWGTSIEVDVEIPQLDTSVIEVGTRVSVLVNTEGDTTAERVVRATWTGLGFEVLVTQSDGTTLCTGRALVQGSVLQIGGIDNTCFGEVTEVGISPGIGLLGADGQTTFDRAGPSALTPLRRAAPLDPANTGADPTSLQVTSPATRPATPGLTRIAGVARLETSLAISGVAWPEGAAGAVVARQDIEADALAGAALAAAVRGPLLLTTSSGVPNLVATELRRILPQGARVYVLGGEAALSDQVPADLQQLGFGTVRLSGATRLETGLAIAQEASTLIDSVQEILIADANEYQWALMAGAAAGANDGVVLTTNASGLSPEAEAFLQQHPDAAVTAVGPTATTARPQARSLNADGDPYATSALVAQVFFSDPTQAVVASGEAFPDGLSGGALAGSLQVPLLLSRRNVVPTPVRSYLSSGTWNAITMLGGEAALTPAVAETLDTYVP